jgi:hypothetical protein
MADQDLQARVKKLNDIEQVRNAIAKFSICDNLQPDPNTGNLDEAQLQQFASLFTDDLIIEVPDAYGPGAHAVRGKSEFLNWQREGFGARIAFIVHEFFNPWIEVDGDRATARFYRLSPSMAGPPGARVAFWSHSQYDNEYHRVNGEWLIKQMRMTRSFLTPYEAGWHKVGFDMNLGERGRRAVLPPEHAKLIEESGDRVQTGLGEGWRRGESMDERHGP